MWWGQLQVVLSERLSGSVLCTAGFHLAPLLSLSLSAAGTKWAIAAAPANQLQTRSRHFLVFIDPWHLIGLSGAQITPSSHRRLYVWNGRHVHAKVLHAAISANVLSGRVQIRSDRRVDSLRPGHKTQTTSQKKKLVRKNCEIVLCRDETIYLNRCVCEDGQWL